MLGHLTHMVHDMYMYMCMLESQYCGVALMCPYKLYTYQKLIKFWNIPNVHVHVYMCVPHASCLSTCCISKTTCTCVNLEAYRLFCRIHNHKMYGRLS